MLSVIGIDDSGLALLTCDLCDGVVREHHAPHHSLNCSEPEEDFMPSDFDPQFLTDWSGLDNNY